MLVELVEVQEQVIQIFFLDADSCVDDFDLELSVLFLCFLNGVDIFIFALDQRVILKLMDLLQKN